MEARDRGAGDCSADMKEVDWVELVVLVRLAMLGRWNHHQEALTDQMWVREGSRPTPELVDNLEDGELREERGGPPEFRMCEFPVVHHVGGAVTPKLVSPGSRKRGQDVT